MKDHASGCEGRNYSCTCGYDDATAARMEVLEARISQLESAILEAQKYGDWVVNYIAKSVMGDGQNG